MSQNDSQPFVALGFYFPCNGLGVPCYVPVTERWLLWATWGLIIKILTELYLDPPLHRQRQTIGLRDHWRSSAACLRQHLFRVDPTDSRSSVNPGSVRHVARQAQKIKPSMTQNKTAACCGMWDRWGLQRIPEECRGQWQRGAHLVRESGPRGRRGPQPPLGLCNTGRFMHFLNKMLIFGCMPLDCNTFFKERCYLCEVDLFANLT